MALVKILQPLFDKLRWENNPPKMSIYASALGSCPRRFALEKTVTGSTFGFEQKRIFDIGNDFGNRYAEYLDMAGVQLGAEIDVHDPSRGVRGRLDSLIKIDGEEIVVEFKTAAASSYNTIIKSPKKNHKLQCAYYMQQRKVTNGIIAYIIKEGHVERDGEEKLKFPMIEHQIKMTPKLSAEVDTAIARLRSALDMLVNDGEITNDVDKSECSFCSFNQECPFSYMNSDNRPTSLSALFKAPKE